MDWILSPLGIGIVIILILAIASLIYWQRKPIKGWLGRQQIDEVELSAGPLKVKLKEKEKRGSPAPPTAAGVDFGEGGDFSGATIRASGRDLRRGSTAARQSPGGKTPGVDFGSQANFQDADIEVAGRDLVED